MKVMRRERRTPVPRVLFNDFDFLRLQAMERIHQPVYPWQSMPCLDLNEVEFSALISVNVPSLETVLLRGFPG